jgi:dephospho-CoA kinase
MKILKIAVTGSAGSGKSLVCQRLNKIGLVTLDCDVIARQVVEPGTFGFNKIVELFGQQVVLENGELNRKNLRNIIVNDLKIRKELENILHPLILSKMIFQMENSVYRQKKAVAVEVPLLFESGMEKYFDVSIAVMAQSGDLVSRIADRDSVTKDNAQKMLDLQMPQKEKIARADYVIKNFGTSSELFESVDDIFAMIEKEFLTI